KRYDRAFAPVLVIDLSAVFCGDGWHEIFSFQFFFLLELVVNSCTLHLNALRLPRRCCGHNCWQKPKPAMYTARSNQPVNGLPGEPQIVIWVIVRFPAIMRPLRRFSVTVEDCDRIQVHRNLSRM